ncbi:MULTISPECIES: hypothetical protein [unclassified Myroides]|uniref:hypothetical protein n=1 Tax=unclassified Myroides TaxID=2642485 RepID=UPI003D2F7A3A
MKNKTNLLAVLLCLISFNLKAQILEIYSNTSAQEYLGCLNCPSENKNSVWNSHGIYGNEYNKKSIWNKYGIYGDDTSNYSPWNQHAEKPPIIKKEGEFHGYFTLNEIMGQRVEVKLTRMLYDYYIDLKEDPTNWLEIEEQLKKR